MKKNLKLPKNEIFVLPNMDKLNHEVPDMENLANLPKPHRTILCAEPNLGKSNIIKNILYNANPPYERTVIFHSNPTSTYIEEIPEVDLFDENINRVHFLYNDILIDVV